ncbi:MAG: outer membrane beta-barrel protein [Chitinophagaceae bacterium]|nr:outer membrane beta-barrel protein [Chitinophagaceae bacterium]
MTATASAKAQWRLQIQTGPSFSLRSQNTDSLFASKNQAFHAQAAVRYDWGHLGLSLTLGYLQQNRRSDANINRPPAFLSGIDAHQVAGGGVKAVYLLAGPEFCFACGPKFKFNVGIRAGVSFVEKNTFQLLDQNAVEYENQLQSKTPFTFNTGLAAHYFFDEHWAVGLMADYHHFCLKATNRDKRNGINNLIQLKQSKDFLNLGLGVTYKF